jgi:hypothetical protein
VQDGKAEPDRKVSRGEMAEILARATNRIEFEALHRIFILDDEEPSRPYLFDDVNQSHPQYAAIQKCVQLGLIAKEGKRFEPDRAITRLEAAEMAVRLLGYKELVDKPEIFKAPFQDVAKEKQPVVALASAFQLFPTLSGSTFSPNVPMTRADVALLLQQLQKAAEKK